MTVTESASPHPSGRFARLTEAILLLGVAGFAFWFYASTAAPGLTWANYGADGGDLLAAAVTNGIPHPTGYPLYTLLLRGWLDVWGLFAPGSDIAWRGNLFSSFAAALSVAVTVQVVRRLWGERPDGLPAGLLAGIAWMTAPLAWGQALITEVYALHTLLFSGLFWALVGMRGRLGPGRALVLGGLLGLGFAHHVTIGLLLPGVLYWLWREEREAIRSPRFWLWLGAGALPGLLLYARMPLAAGAAPPAPVNWMGSGSVADFWWLISGAAYQRYLFAVPPGFLLAKVGGWAQTITSQFTPLGMALALAGLARWDRLRGVLRGLSLLWVLPVSLYALAYNTTDSAIYLLPVVWLMSLWLPFGVAEGVEWLQRRRGWRGWEPVVLGSCMAGILLLTIVRLPSLSLRQDDSARRFLAGAVQVLEPESIVFSSADAETFALWYGAWASGELLEAAPGSALVNVALLQFEWYRALLVRLYPDLAGVESGDAAAILRANAGVRPIFFSEIVAPAGREQVRPAGSIWRYQPQDGQ